MLRVGEYFRSRVSMDCESNVPVDYCVIFPFIALFICMAGLTGFCTHHALSTIAVAGPVRPLRPASVDVAHIDTRIDSDAAAVTSNLVATTADTGPVSDATRLPNLVATTLSSKGKVVYFDRSTGKLFMKIGNLYSSGQAINLDLGAISPIEHEAGESGGSDIERKICDHSYISKSQISIGRRGYKQRVRSQLITIEPEQFYCPGQVAALLNLSYDSALRLMLKMKGVVDFGTPRRRYNRGKRKPRINGKDLLTFINNKTIV